MSAAVGEGARRPRLLVVGSGHRLYREYLLSSLAEKADIWLLDFGAVTWQRPYVVDSAVVDRDEVDGVFSSALRIARAWSVDGCVTWDEFSVTTVARICEALRLPGFGVEAAEACRDKLATRTALAAAGVAQPEFRAVRGLEEARAAVADLGVPCVMKPRRLGASLGVSVVGDLGDVEAAYEQASTVEEADIAASEELIVETALVGHEVSVDCAIVGGEVMPLFIAHKESGFPPWCEEVGHAVRGDDELLHDASLLSLLRRAHAALGVRSGITHTEVFLTAGGPAVVEVNPRWGGDLIPRLATSACGVDVGAVTADVATGRVPGAALPSDGAAVIAFRYPATSGVVTDIEVPAASCSAGVEVSVGALADVGDTLLLPPEDHVSGRYAYVLATGPDEGSCRAAIVSAGRGVRVAVAPRVAED